jgi:hypothetical protein
MAKTLKWEYKDEEELHTIKLVYSYFTGKAIVTIDGDEFNISTRPLGLKGTNQVFRLGEMPAIIDFPKSGEPDIVIDGIYQRSKKPYNA